MGPTAPTREIASIAPIWERATVRSLGLRARLILAVALVVVAAVGFVGYYSSRVAETAFVRMTQVEETVSGPGAPAEELERVYGPVGEGEVVLEPGVHGRDGRDGRDRRVVEREMEGPLAAEDLAPGTVRNIRTERFTGRVNRALLWGVGAAGLLALVLAAVTANRMLAPVGALTRSARRMAAGDLAQRVPVTTRDELGELSTAFNAMAASLERMDRSRREMVSDVAHELRTPLTNVRCQLEAIQDGLAQADRPMIDSLHEEVLLFSHLVDDLRELALAAAGRLDLQPVPLDLAAEVRRAAEAAGAAHPGAHAEISVVVSDGLGATADPRRLQQVLRNLLVNALRHTPVSGTVEISARRLDRGEAGAGPDEIEIAVTDSGDGIAAELLPEVFERFTRTDPSRSRHTGGSGLGLAIVKQLVEAHGGRVGVESNPGEGSRFWLTLPS